MIVCSCGTIMNPVQIGVFVEEVLPDGEPYKVWAADRIACPKCAAVCFKTASNPTAEHFQGSYSGWAAECVLKFGGKP